MPPGIIPKNENKGDEMVDIMSTLHQYVPVVEYTEEHYIPSSQQSVLVPRAYFHPIIIGGDQLTAARGRVAKKAKLHADSPVSRLEGLIPVAEDWHTKVNLLEVSIPTLYVAFRPNQYFYHAGLCAKQCFSVIPTLGYLFDSVIWGTWNSLPITKQTEPH